MGNYLVKIEDKGKVWFPGTSNPVLAIRVGDTVFALGSKESQEVEYWVEGNYLHVDLHDKNAKIRIARRFTLEIVPSISAMLFGGFTNTQHANIKVVTQHDAGVEEWQISGVNYTEKGISTLSRQEFWKQAVFSKS